MAAVIGVGLAALPAHAEEAPFDISAQGGPPYDEFFYADGGAEAQSAYFLLSLQSDGDLVAIDNLHVEFGIDDLGGALARHRPSAVHGRGAVITRDFDGLVFTELQLQECHRHRWSDWTIT